MNIKHRYCVSCLFDKCDDRCKCKANPYDYTIDEDPINGFNISYEYLDKLELNKNYDCYGYINSRNVHFAIAIFMGIALSIVTRYYIESFWYFASIPAIMLISMVLSAVTESIIAFIITKYRHNNILKGKYNNHMLKIISNYYPNLLEKIKK